MDELQPRYACVSCATPLIAAVFPDGPENPCAVCQAEARPPVVTGPVRVKGTGENMVFAVGQEKPPALAPASEEPRKRGRKPNSWYIEHGLPIPRTANKHTINREPVTQEPPPAGCKRCSKCQEIKPVEAFNKNGRAADGINYWCKACQKAANAARNVEPHTQEEAPAPVTQEEPTPWPKPGSRQGDPRNREHGRLGGLKTAARGAEYFREIGRKGGAATKEGQPPGFYQSIGRKSQSSPKRAIAVEPVELHPTPTPPQAPAPDPNARPAWLTSPLTIVGCAAAVGVPVAKLLAAIDAGELLGWQTPTGAWVTDVGAWVAYRETHGLGKVKK